MEKTATATHPSVPLGASSGFPQTPQPVLLSPRDAARSLAISERTLWSITKRGDVRSVKIGRAVRYDVGDLRTFIEQSKLEGRGA